MKITMIIYIYLLFNLIKIIIIIIIKLNTVEYQPLTKTIVYYYF